MAEIELEVKNNVSDVSKRLMNALEKAGIAIGADATGFMADNCPVNTGNLINSLGAVHDVHEDSVDVYIGSKGVDYAIYVEEGNYHHINGTNHFIRKSATEHSDVYRKRLKDALRSEYL